MSEIKDGGPAFPPNGEWKDHQGMTLRDYFAAKAMQGYVPIQIDNDWSDTDVAKYSYMLADAMLRAREAKP